MRSKNNVLLFSASAILAVILAVVFTSLYYSNPDLTSPSAFMAKGDASYKSQNHPDALKFYDIVTTLDPNQEDAWFKMGLIERRSGNYEKALVYNNKSIMLDQEKPEIWTERGNLFWELGKQEMNKNRSKIYIDEANNCYYNSSCLYIGKSIH